MRARAATVGAVLAAAVGISACDGSTSTADRRISSGRLTVVVSLPLTGASRAAGQAALQGARMALAAAHGHVGRYTITLRPLDDASVARDGWDPGPTTQNARAAARDPRVVGYVGELNSGATAVALPVLNRAMVPQIGPLSTAAGLTRGGPEASPGEPQKYYPTTKRTFARVIPSDIVQSAVIVQLQRRAGCERPYTVYDDEVDGRDAATSYQAAAHAADLDVLGYDQYDPTAHSYAGLQRKLVKLDPDCVLIGAVPQDNAAAVTTAIARALPSAALFAPASLADRSYTRQLPASVAPRVTITSATLAARDYPPAGRRFLAAFARRHGGGQLDAIFGYESMALMVDAISRASRDGTRTVDRPRVLQALMSTHDRHSVLGTYSIGPTGDTTLRRFGVYRIAHGRMVFAEALRG